jgi:hypothetical protein
MTIAERISAALGLNNKLKTFLEDQSKGKMLYGRLVERVPGSLASQPEKGSRSAVFLDYPKIKSAKLIPESQRASTEESFKKVFENADTPLFDPVEKGGAIPRVYDLSFRNQLNNPLSRLDVVSPEETLAKFENHALSGSVKGLQFMTGIASQGSIGFDYSKAGAKAIPTINVTSEKALKELKSKGKDKNYKKTIQRLIDDPGSVLGHELEHAVSDGNKMYFTDGKSALKRFAYAETPAVFAEMAHQLNAVKPESYTGLKAINIRPSAYSGTMGEKGSGVSADFFRRSSKEHFINKGRSMTDLLSTPEGKQFLSQQMGRSKENKQSRDLAKKFNLDPVEIEKVLGYINQKTNIKR